MNIELYNRILKSSIELQGELKKNGKGFKHQYFRTEDIVPAVLAKCLEYNFGYIPQFDEKEAKLIVFQTDDKRAEPIIYSLPINIIADPNAEKAIQTIGKLQTYYIRYLLIQAFNICEVDELELVNPDKVKQKKVHLARTHPKENLSPKELDDIFNKIRKNCESDNSACWEVEVWRYYDAFVLTDHDRDVLLDRFKQIFGGVDM